MRPLLGLARWAWVGALVCGLFAGAPLAGATRGVAHDEGELVMIVGPTTGFSDIPSEVLRDAYLGLPVQHEGVRLIPFNAPVATPVRVRMDLALLGLTQDQVGSFWVNQRVRDGRSPPRSVPSLELAVRLVAQLPRAIACVPTTFVSPHVHALRIDGKGPSDPGYLLAPR